MSTTAPLGIQVTELDRIRLQRLVTLSGQKRHAIMLAAVRRYVADELVRYEALAEFEKTA